MLASHTAPVLHARDFGALVAYYRRILRFEVVREIAGVVAVVRRGALQLQIWAGRADAPRDCRIELGRDLDIFRLYADLASVARSAMVDEYPHLTRWGSWDFRMCDAQGNRLLFTQWAVPAPA